MTESAPPVRIGLKLPPPEPPRFSLSFKIFFAAALLIFIAIGGAIAISTYQARRVADAKIASDLTKSGPAWESFQQNRYGELHRALGVVVSNPGLIGVMTLDPLSPATTIDTLKAEQASNARADFLLAADRVDHRSCSQKQQSLEESMRHQMENSRRERSRAARHEHVAKLRDS